MSHVLNCVYSLERDDSRFAARVGGQCFRTRIFLTPTTFSGERAVRDKVQSFFETRSQQISGGVTPVGSVNRQRPNIDGSKLSVDIAQSHGAVIRRI